MSKFASFILVMLIFLFMSVVVSFGFFSFTPKIKAKRLLSIELEQKNMMLDAAEKKFDQNYKQLQQLQEREKYVDLALEKRFDETRFEHFIAQHFNRYALRSITTEQELAYQADIIDISAITTSPVTFYRFVDMLNRFDWVAEVVSTQQFRSVPDGVETHFVLKVYTRKK